MSIHKVCAEDLMLLHVMTKSLKFIIYRCNLAKTTTSLKPYNTPFNLTTSSPQLCHNLTTIYLQPPHSHQNFPITLLQPPCNLITTSLLFPQNLFATLLQPCFNPHATFCTTTSLQPCLNISAISLQHHRYLKSL